ncbi:MAG: S-layer homology domain-containing protein [Candidatus Ornithomonoglobus sp.]
MKKTLFFATALAVAASSFSAFAAAPLYSFWDKPDEFTAEQLNAFGVPKTDTVTTALDITSGTGNTYANHSSETSTSALSSTSNPFTVNAKAELDMSEIAQEWEAYLKAADKLAGREAAIAGAKLTGEFKVEIVAKGTGSTATGDLEGIENAKLAAKDSTGWSWDEQTLELFKQKGEPTYVDEGAGTRTFTLTMEIAADNQTLADYFAGVLDGTKSKTLTLLIPDNTIQTQKTPTTTGVYFNVKGNFSGSVKIEILGQESEVSFESTDTEYYRIYKRSSSGGGGGGTSGSTATTPPKATTAPNATENPNATTAPEATTVPGRETERPTAVPNPKTGGTENGAKLNYDDHYAYVIGYPAEEGQSEDYREVRPQNNITRAEVATIFFRMLTDSSRAEFWTQDNSYSDVVITDWYNNAISTATNAGIVNGYDDGTFGPNKPITRAEFAAIAARFDTDPYTGTDQFSDISGHWAEEYINKAAADGWINGYEDGTFRPDQYIVRSEAMTLINRLLYRLVDEEGLNTADMVKWVDNEPGTWYYANVQEATNSHHFERTAIGAYETWTTMREPRDWEALEKSYSQVTDAGSEESVYFDEEARDDTSIANAEATEAPEVTEEAEATDETVADEEAAAETTEGTEATEATEGSEEAE